MLCHRNGTSSSLSAVNTTILREGGQSSVGIVDPGGFVPDVSVTASDRSRGRNRKSNSFRKKVGRGNRRTMKAESPAPSTGRGNLGDKIVSRRKCQGGENRSVSGNPRRHSRRGVNREDTRTASPRSSGEG